MLFQKNSNRDKFLIAPNHEGETKQISPWQFSAHFKTEEANYEYVLKQENSKKNQMG